MSDPFSSSSSSESPLAADSEAYLAGHSVIPLIQHLLQQLLLQQPDAPVDFLIDELQYHHNPRVIVTVDGTNSAASSAFPAPIRQTICSTVSQQFPKFLASKKNGINGSSTSSSPAAVVPNLLVLSVADILTYSESKPNLGNAAKQVKSIMSAPNAQVELSSHSFTSVQHARSMAQMISSRTREQDARQQGFILCDYPNTILQAKELEAAGVFPTHVIVLGIEQISNSGGATTFSSSSSSPSSFAENISDAFHRAPVALTNHSIHVVLFRPDDSAICAGASAKSTAMSSAGVQSFLSALVPASVSVDQ